MMSALLSSAFVVIVVCVTAVLVMAVVEMSVVVVFALHHVDVLEVLDEEEDVDD